MSTFVEHKPVLLIHSFLLKPFRLDFTFAVVRRIAMLRHQAVSLFSVLDKTSQSSSAEEGPWRPILGA